jgi:uncharacterized protein YjiS (DUF1127 family)
MNVSSLATDFARSWKRYREYRATVYELSALGDRNLADVGIGRTDIRRIARDAVR